MSRLRFDRFAGHLSVDSGRKPACSYRAQGTDVCRPNRNGRVDGNRWIRKRGTAPTFAQVYNNILVVYCSGSSCHNPGSQSGVSFSSQSNAYSAVKNRVTPGNGAGSSFYTTVNNGVMPPGGKLSAANLALIKAWIDAGALNN